MAYSGTERMVRAKNAINNASEESLAKDQKNSNEVAIKIKKFPLKNPTSHNHSK
jgi:hypothetical protein